MKLFCFLGMFELSEEVKDFLYEGLHWLHFFVLQVLRQQVPREICSLFTLGLFMTCICLPFPLCVQYEEEKRKKKSTKKRSPWCLYKTLFSSLYSGTDCHCNAWWITWQSAVPASVSEHQQGEHPAHHLFLDSEERSSIIYFFLFLSLTLFFYFFLFPL